MSLYCRIYTGIITLFILTSLTSGATSIDSGNIHAPVSSASWFIGAKYYGGYTFSPYERISNLEAHTRGLEVLISRKTFGKRTWEQINGYPRIGLAIDYIDLGKPELAGQVYAIIPHLQWTLFGKNSSVLALRFGTGLGYFNTVFNPITNYRDKAISTPFNACLQLNLVYTKRIFKYAELNAGIGLTHFSNGSIRVPNSGINIPAIFAGANYILFKPETHIQRPAEELKPKKKDYFYAYSAISFETRGFDREEHYTIYSLSAIYGRQISPISKLGIGMDFFYDKTVPSDSLGNVIPARHITDPLEMGIKIEHELLMGKLGLITNAGVYIYHPTVENGLFYQILGLKYNFLPNFFVVTALKTHFAKADFIQFGLGVNF